MDVTLVGVDEITLGSALMGPASVGDTALLVDDSLDYVEGGRLTLNGVIYDFDSVDDDTNVVTLSEGVAVSVAGDVGDPVTVLKAADAPSQYVAMVTYEDVPVPIPVPIPPNLNRYFLEAEPGSVISVRDDGTGGYVVDASSADAAAEGGTRTEGSLTIVEGDQLLTNGVSAPTVGPQLGKTWVDRQTYTQTDVDPDLGTWRGLVDNDVEWISAVALYGGHIRFVNKATGATTGLFNLPSNFNPWGGLAKVADRLYVLGADYNRSGAWYVYAYTLAGSKVDEWPITLAGTSPRWPSICADPATGGLRVNYWTTAGVSTNRIISTPYTTAGSAGASLLINSSNKQDIRGSYVGSADFGANRLVILGANNAYVFDTSAAALAPGESWIPSPELEHRGLAWDGTRFHSLGSSSKVWHYSRTVTATSRSVRFSWFDNDAAGDGQHETQASPATATTQAARQWLSVYLPSPAYAGGVDDPNASRVYIANQLQPDLATAATFAAYDVPATGGAAPPTFNGFQGVSSPGRVYSGASDSAGPLTEFDGAGRARAAKLIQSGTVTVSVVNANESTPLNVTFPVPFDSVPRVWASVKTTRPDLNVATASDATKTGLTVYAVRTTGGGSTLVEWFATTAW